MPELTGRRLAVVFGLGLLVGIVAVVAAVMLLARSSSADGCVKLEWKGTPPAWLKRADPSMSTCG